MSYLSDLRHEAHDSFDKSCDIYESALRERDARIAALEAAARAYTVKQYEALAEVVEAARRVAATDRNGGCVTPWGDRVADALVTLYDALDSLDTATAKDAYEYAPGFIDKPTAKGG